MTVSESAQRLLDALAYEKKHPKDGSGPVVVELAWAELRLLDAELKRYREGRLRSSVLAILQSPGASAEEILLAMRGFMTITAQMGNDNDRVVDR